jgi:hypothetical protein
MLTEIEAFYMPSTYIHIVDNLVSKCPSTMKAVARIANTRKQRHNILEQCLHFILLEYYRYEVTFGPYVMTPTERLVTNIFVILVLSLLCWALLLYSPSLLYRKLTRVMWLLTGHGGEILRTDQGLLEGPRNPVVPVGS